MGKEILKSSQTGEVDLKKILEKLNRHKLFIAFVTLLFGILFSVYAYYQSNVYQSDTVVEIGSGKRAQSQKEDLLTMALGAGNVNLDTEIGIIMSRKVALDTLERVNVTHHYYKLDGYKRPKQLYLNVPFEVNMTKGFNIQFDVYPIDNKMFKLVVEGEDENGTKWSHEKLHPYSKEIIEDNFSFVLGPKNAKAMIGNEYRFLIFDPVRAMRNLQKNLAAEQLTEKSSLVRVSYKDEVPLRAKKVVNAVAESYIDHALESKTIEATSILEFIDDQLAEIDRGLRQSELELEKYKKTTNTVSLNTKAEDIVRRLSELESKLAKVEIERKMLDSLYKQVQKGKDLEKISVAGLNVTDTGLPSLIIKLQDAVLKRKAYLEDYTRAHPKVVRASRAVEQIKGILKTNIQTLKKHLDKRRKLLSKSVAKHKKMLESLPENERRLGRLNRNFTVNEKVYSFLLEKRASAVIAKAGSISENKILDTAIIPERPIGPKRKVIAISGFLLGLLLSIGIILFRDHLDTRIKDEDDVRSITSLPLVATIPRFKDSDNKAKVIMSPKSGASEAFRALRSNLSFLSHESNSMAISITSTIGGEGKTTVSINLGAIMSMAGNKTIIVDLDMRKPKLHQRLHLSNSKGISSVLANKMRLQDVIQSSEYAELDFIPSGPIPPNPSELIESQTMAQIVQALKNKYDVVIFDMPPVGLVTDALAMMHVSDVVLYILRAEYSEKDFIKNIERISSDHEIKSIGLILNDVVLDKIGYGYGHGYYEE